MMRQQCRLRHRSLVACISNSRGCHNLIFLSRRSCEVFVITRKSSLKLQFLFPVKTQDRQFRRHAAFIATSTGPFGKERDTATARSVFPTGPVLHNSVVATTTTATSFSIPAAGALLSLPRPPQLQPHSACIHEPKPIGTQSGSSTRSAVL
jgi:hypothetical protein